MDRTNISRPGEKPGRGDGEQAFAPIGELLSDTLILSPQLARRWRLTNSYLSNLRYGQRGIPYVRLGPTTVRYRLTDIVRVEALGIAGPPTVATVVLAISFCPDLTLEERSRAQEHFGAKSLARTTEVIAGEGALPLPELLLTHATYKPLADLMWDTLVRPQHLASRWKMSVSRLSSLRRERRGLPFIRLPLGARGFGGIRYRLSEIMVAEERGAPQELTSDEIDRTIVTCTDITLAQRVKLAKHVRNVLTTDDEAEDKLST